MKIAHLSETVSVNKISDTGYEGVFEIEGLYAGYGITVGNALRRVLYSSLPGAAITQISIKGTNHEFSTLSGMNEDVVELMLNLKKIRFHLYSDEPQVVSLKAKGVTDVVAGDIKTNAQIDVITPDVHIASLSAKNADLEIDITVEKGLGFRSSESRKSEKLPVGVIVLDAAFSPVVKVNFVVENMRVGDRTDFNRVRFTIHTDGSITPSQALHQACIILQDHFTKISLVEKNEEIVEGEEEKSKKK